MGRTACTEPQCLYKGALYLLYTFNVRRGFTYRRTEKRTSFAIFLCEHVNNDKLRITVNLISLFCDTELTKLYTRTHTHTYTHIIFNLRTAAFKVYCAIWVRRSNFRHQASPRLSPRERIQRRKVELWTRNVLPKCPRYI